MLNRNFTLFINYILDNLCPPIIRDCKFIMKPIIYFAYGKTTNAVLSFKEQYPFMNESEIAKYYELIKSAPVNKRETDLNSACLNFITNNIMGETVLDTACGRGFLARKIFATGNLKVTASDIVQAGELPKEIIYKSSSLVNLNFRDQEFDTVICTHALEHIRDYRIAIKELCRVTKKRLIIVVPRQREYLYTPDLHVNFCPYMYRFKEFIGIKDAKYFELNRDFVCVVDF